MTKTNKKITKKKIDKHRITRRRLSGGVRIRHPYNAITAINYFIRNSSFSIFSKNGVSCVIIQATLNSDPNNSPYRMIRLQYLNKPVTTILFKIFILGKTIGDIHIQPTTTEIINNEIHIQQNVFTKSINDEMTLLEPCCPALLYTHSSKVKSPLKNVLYQYLSRDIQDSIISTIFENDIAFIAMETMDEYKTLYSLKTSPHYEKYKFMAFCELDRLHRIGYIHNDFHFENVLIHESYYYSNLFNGRAIIIDFGLSQKIDESPEFLNDNKRLQLLQDEYGSNELPTIQRINQYYENHLYVQSYTIDIIEQRLSRSIRNILSQNLFTFYRMNGSGTKDIDIELNERILQNKERLRKIREDNPDVYQTKTTDKEIKSWFANGSEQLAQRIHPKSYNELLQGIDSILEMERTDPHYFTKLVRAQTNGMIIDK